MGTIETVNGKGSWKHTYIHYESLYESGAGPVERVPYRLLLKRSWQLEEKVSERSMNSARCRDCFYAGNTSPVMAAGYFLGADLLGEGALISNYLKAIPEYLYHNPI